MSSKFSNDLANGMDSILKDSKFQRIFSKTASVKAAQSGKEILESMNEDESFTHDLKWLETVTAGTDTEILESMPMILRSQGVKFAANYYNNMNNVFSAKTTDGQIYYYIENPVNDFPIKGWQRDKVSEGPLKEAEKAFNMFKTTIKIAGEEIFDIQGLAEQYPDAYNALLMPDKIKFRDYQFHINSAGKICAKDPVGTDEYIFLHSPDRAPTWMKTAESTESSFNAFASKKKKEEDESDEDDKKDKSDKKKDDKDSDKDEKSDKKSKKDEDKDDKKSKKSKKDDDDKDESDKDNKNKSKKKPFPFWLKKKKAGVDEKCECGKEECDCGDKMYANAIRHIVESFTVTSDVLDNMGLEKSAVATMAILDHIIEEAATIKFASESKEHALKEKIKHLVDKFEKMHESENGYDPKIAKALDEKIEKLEEELKELKKKDLKTDENDVRGTDLLLGLEDEEAHEGYNDPELDDPKSSAVLEDILSKNPKLVNDIVPGLKSQFSDRDIEEQLKSRIQSRLPEVVHTPENTDIEAILKAYEEAHNIPGDAKLPGDFEKGPKIDPLKTQIDELKTNIDELNAIDRDMDDDELVKIMVKKLQNHFEDFDDYGEVNCTKLAEDIADEFDLYEGDNVPERVFEAAIEAAEAYDSLKDNDEESEELNFSDDIVRAYKLVNEWTKKAHEFEDDSDDKINVGDVESILDVLGNYSNDEINEREKSFKHPENLNELTDEFYDAAIERKAK